MAPDIPSRDRLQLAREYRDMAGCGCKRDDLEDIRDLDTDLGALFVSYLTRLGLFGAYDQWWSTDIRVVWI